MSTATSVTGTWTDPSSPCPSPGPAGRRGFTLVEILVVLVVVGVVLTAAVLSLRVGPGAELLQEEGKRLLALTRLARDEAVLRGEEIGLRVEPGRYAFLVLKREGWVPVGDAPVFRPRELPAVLTLRLTVDGVDVSARGSRSRGADGLPDVVLWSSGEVTPFVAVLSLAETPNEGLALVGTAAGSLTLRRLDGRG